MISGKKKFVQGKPFEFIKTSKAKTSKKGRTCAGCGRYRKIELFTGIDEECNKCKA